MQYCFPLEIQAPLAHPCVCGGGGGGEVVFGGGGGGWGSEALEVYFRSGVGGWGSWTPRPTAASQQKQSHDCTSRGRLLLLLRDSHRVDVDSSVPPHSLGLTLLGPVHQFTWFPVLFDSVQSPSPVQSNSIPPTQCSELTALARSNLVKFLIFNWFGVYAHLFLWFFSPRNI